MTNNMLIDHTIEVYTIASTLTVAFVSYYVTIQ
jgi:hypothetical protein